ncbi:MAG: hypothetical protein WCV00_06325 [Verrucomicrobiia bacterium]
MNTTQTNHATTEVRREWKSADGLLIPLLVSLIAVLVISTAAQAQNTPPPPSNVNAALRDASNREMTLGQMAYQFARSLTPPFLGSREADAITWLMGGQVGEQAGHQPPLSPLGGWENLNRPATVGDLTVLLVQQFKIEPTAAAGGQPTAQDYQNALVGYMGSASVSTYNSIASIFNDWVSPTINVLGPTPSPGNPTRSSPSPNP